MCWALSPGEKIYSVTLENGSKENYPIFENRPIFIENTTKSP